jgi:hypothetical protein
MKDKLADMYMDELNDMANDEYTTDKKRIDQNEKVFQALLDILTQDDDLYDYAQQLLTAHINVQRAHEIRAFKMGITTGQTIAQAKA